MAGSIRLHATYRVALGVARHLTRDEVVNQVSTAADYGCVLVSRVSMICIQTALCIFLIGERL